MEIINKDLVDFWNALNNMGKERGAKFGFAVLKNGDMIRKQIAVLKAAQNKKPESLTDFDKERIALCLEYADTDDDGNPITVGTTDDPNFQIVEKREEFDAKVEVLQEKYKQTFDELSSFIGEFNSMLMEACEFNIHMVSIDQVPETLSVEQISSIRIMISGFDD